MNGALVLVRCRRCGFCLLFSQGEGAKKSKPHQESYGRDTMNARFHGNGHCLSYQPMIPQKLRLKRLPEAMAHFDVSTARPQAAPVSRECHCWQRGRHDARSPLFLGLGVVDQALNLRALDLCLRGELHTHAIAGVHDADFAFERKPDVFRAQDDSQRRISGERG